MKGFVSGLMGLGLLFLTPFSHGHNPNQLLFKFKATSGLAQKQEKGLPQLAAVHEKLWLEIKESFTKDLVTPELLKNGSFKKAFVVGRSGSFLQILQPTFEKGVWSFPFELPGADSYTLWLEGRLNSEKDEFMTLFRFRVSPAAQRDANHDENILHAEQGEQTFELDPKTLEIKVSDKKGALMAHAPLWKENWQLIATNTDGTSLLHSELQVLPDKSQIKLIFPHGPFGEILHRAWILTPQRSLYFQWTPSAK
jgi:hypothetical protein